MRLFLAIDPGLQVRRDLLDASAPLRDAAPGVRWIGVDRLHLTLKFLGEQDPAMLGPLTAMLDRVSPRHRIMSLAVGGLGAFPNMRAPRVIWMGIRPDPRLEFLQHELEEGCERLGVPVEGRPFRPHVTLGRVPDGARIDVPALAHAAGNVTWRGEIMADAIALVSSEQHAGAPRYRTLSTVPLGGAG